MQTTFELSPEEWTDAFWKRIMPLFRQKAVRVTVEEIESAVPGSQYEVYMQLKSHQSQFPPVKIDESIDLSRLADEAGNVNL